MVSSLHSYLSKACLSLGSWFFCKNLLGIVVQRQKGRTDREEETSLPWRVVSHALERGVFSEIGVVTDG